MFYILGVICGLLLPVQTCQNSKLAVKSGSTFYANLISFVESVIILYVMVLVQNHSFSIGLNKLDGYGAWIYLGGVFGVVFMSVVTVLNFKLGVVQTVVLPILGQIIMSLLIDNFGWFESDVIPLDLWRIVGAAVVFTGVVLTTFGGDSANSENTEKKWHPLTLLFQILGVASGAVGSVSTAINGRLGTLLGSATYATTVSFTMGSLTLIVICVVYCIVTKGLHIVAEQKSSWWMWFGGISGLVYVYASIFLAGRIGTALTVILMLTGSTIGGLAIDQTGMFESQIKKITVKKILGVLIMIAGVGIIRFI